MCLIIASISLIFALNLFMAKEYIGCFIAIAISGIFIYLMISNIIRVKKERSNDS